MRLFRLLSAFVLLAVLLTACKGGDSNYIKNYSEGTTVFSATESGKTTEVEFYSDRKEFCLFIDGKFQQVVSGGSSGTEGVLVLPKAEKAENIAKREPVSQYVWDVSLDESASYVKHLSDYGYSVVREIHTSQFVELIMQFGSSRKRIIIFSHTMIAADLIEGAVLSPISDYLKKYTS